MEIKGIIEVIFDEVKISDTFKKREFVIDAKSESKYENFIKFELVQEKCELINDFKIGDNINVLFNINGRKWINPEGKEVYFNSLKAWRLMPMDETTHQALPTEQKSSDAMEKKEPEWLNDSKTSSTVSDQNDDDDDDLPF